MSGHSSAYRCFMIMPFSGTTKEHDKEYWDRHWRFLKRNIEEIPGIIAYRSEALRGDILRDIIKDLITSDVVVADITDENPNVYWELGVRQSFKHGTVTIAETKKRVAFDMGMKSILRYYPKDALKNDEFISQLKKAILNCIEKPHLPDSNVLETISGRGSIYQIIMHEDIERKLDALKYEMIENEDTLVRIYSDIKNNQILREKKATEKVSFTTIYIMCKAIELLLINRYLDESLEFYNALLDFYQWMGGINFAIDEWGNNSQFWEKWFEGKQEDIVDSFTKTIELIDITYYKFKLKKII